MVSFEIFWGIQGAVLFKLVCHKVICSGEQCGLWTFWFLIFFFCRFCLLYKLFFSSNLFYHYLNFYFRLFSMLQFKIQDYFSSLGRFVKARGDGPVPEILYTQLFMDFSRIFFLSPQ